MALNVVVRVAQKWPCGTEGVKYMQGRRLKLNLALDEIQIPLQIHRGSYMSAHVLLNLLNELGKRDKM